MKQFRYAGLFFSVASAVMGIGLFAFPSVCGATPVTEFLQQENSDFSADREAVFPKYLTIQGTDIGGMTLEEVRSFVSEYAQERVSRHVTFMVLGSAYEYEMSSFGMTWTNPDLADELETYLLNGNFVEQYTKQKDLEYAPAAYTVDFTFDQEFLAAQVRTYTDHFTASPTNASVQLVEGGFQVIEGAAGHVFDPDAITAELVSLMSDYTQTETLVYDFPHTDTEPQYKSDTFNFTFSVLGECVTRELGEESRRNNIILSASKINGKVVYPGETFTALTWYGEVTEEGGYSVAPTYQDGQQLPGVGGGICQTTTTLYDALLYAEMGISYRSPHSMLVSYVAPSMDAMVDYKSKSDFVAYNNSDYPIYFQSYVDGDNLVVRIWGNETRPANRTVSYESKVLEYEFPDPLYAVDEVNDQVCKVGAYYVSEKMHEEVAPHPYVVSQLWKIVTVDGTVTEQSIVFPEHSDGNGGGYDDYKKMQGVIYHASDCIMTNIKIQDPNSYLGERVHHQICFPNGAEWNEYAYEENMGQ